MPPLHREVHPAYHEKDLLEVNAFTIGHYDQQWTEYVRIDDVESYRVCPAYEGTPEYTTFIMKSGRFVNVAQPWTKVRGRLYASGWITNDV